MKHTEWRRTNELEFRSELVGNRYTKVLYQKWYRNVIVGKPYKIVGPDGPEQAVNVDPKQREHEWRMVPVKLK